MDLNKLKNSVINETKRARNPKILEEVRVKYLGRKGELTRVLRSLKDLPLRKRKQVGPKANKLKEELESIINKRAENLKSQISKLKTKIDLTRPGEKIKSGHLHPLTLIDMEVREIFKSLNFSIIDGPEIEDEYHNFDALNIPPHHPARDMWDTFWLKPTNDKRQTTNNSRGSSVVSRRLLLRTHTSPMQIRYMETHNPPFQIIVPGRVFRYEATDASHETNFYQVEGLMVGKDVSLANFKYVVEEFLKKLFGPDVKFRFRPSYFPFVEPGVEVDIKLTNNQQQTTNNSRRSSVVGRGSGWLEIMGAGMVHRNVFNAVKYNPKFVQGFAFGVGLDRLAMIKYGIPDVRLFYSSDLRFIHQF